MKRLFATIACAVLAFPATPASADSQFPDIDSLPQLPWSTYKDPRANDVYQHSYFTPGDGVWCTYSAHGDSADVGCYGALPATPEPAGAVYFNGGGGHHYLAFNERDGSRLDPDPTDRPYYKPLPAGHKILVRNPAAAVSVTCGTPAGVVLACRIVSDATGETNGFVLSDQGSWTF